MGLLLGIDAGTTSLKVGLFNSSGRELSSAAEEYVLRSPQPSRAELDPDQYWTSLIRGVVRALRGAGAEGADVQALAVSSQGQTVIPVAASGAVLGPAVIWLDNRAADEARDLTRRIDRALLYATTGAPAVSPAATACKLLWWRRHDPDLFRSAAHFLLVEEFLLQRLTGRFVSEAGVQSTSLLYDIVQRGWWQPMLDLLELPANRLGDPVEPGTVVGTLSADAAEVLGLDIGVPVVAGGMDQAAGALGVGNAAPGNLSESTGAALTVQACMDDPHRDPDRQLPVHLHSVAQRYLYSPVCPTGGMALTWFRDSFGQAELAQASAGGGPSAYELLTELAEAIPPGADGLTMLPHLSGAISPEREPGARGVFFGFTLGHGRGHFVRALLESVAFMLRRNLELLNRIGAGADALAAHGGGAHSRLWNQIKADVCDLPVVTFQGAESTVRGDAMLAGVATGAFADVDQACVAAVRPQALFETDPLLHAQYETHYRRYVELFDTLRPLFRERV